MIFDKPDRRHRKKFKVVDLIDGPLQYREANFEEALQRLRLPRLRELLLAKGLVPASRDRRGIINCLIQNQHVREFTADAAALFQNSSMPQLNQLLEALNLPARFSMGIFGGFFEIFKTPQKKFVVFCQVEDIKDTF